MSLLNRVGSLLRRLASYAEVSQAVFYGTISISWRLFSGPISVVLIGIYFTPEVQGYYFTFSSLMALQLFVELGLGTVIVQFASHEWSKLSLNNQGRIEGDKEALARLTSLGRFFFRWYLVGGIVFIVLVGFLGLSFFSRSPHQQINWTGPWLMLCLVSGISLLLTPFWALLEGCNQVSQVYYFRMILGFIINLSVWASILSGAGLWTASLSTLVGIIWAVVFLVKRYQRFFVAFLFNPIGPRLNWVSEVLPMQWRMAVSHLSGYFGSYLFTPIIFQYIGPIEAGRFGMTYNLVVTIGGVAAIWATSRRPQFGMLVAQKKYAELDRLLWRIWKISIAILMGGSIALWLFLYVLTKTAHLFATRFLSPLPTAILLTGMVASMVWHPMSVYLRAHKREPLMLLTVIWGLLIGLFAWQLGRRFGSIGAACAYASVNMVISFPFGFYIWYRCRESWHREYYSQ